MAKIVRSFAVISAAIFLICELATAGGLSATLVEVKLKNLQPGKTYSVLKETGQQLVIKNTTENITVDIGIVSEKPVNYNLVPGYEPIPNLSWVEIKTKDFKDLKPGESAVTDIEIKIPPDKKYTGKKYQVYIYSHTAGKETFRMGLMSRILIETGPSTEAKKLPLQR
ncbi:MAG: hypothetical protein NTV07_00670 [Candidatus Omnitrophica bacterium]|nr:hypothetical protein [Candidatus Omnitrophota bacterium]